MRIIGIDCATQPRKMGIAVGELDGQRVRIERVECGSSNVAGQLAELIGDDRTLLALDAPLGWPAGLHEIGPHRAGEPLPRKRDEMFRRETDRFVKRVTGHQPLEVGANLIARTGHSALRLLDDVRETTGEAIPLAWESSFSEQIAAIEVYPAATLRMAGAAFSRYKKEGDRTARENICDAVAQELDLGSVMESVAGNADLLDAAICCLAGADFLSGRCWTPEDLELARVEGWIWVRKT